MSQALVALAATCALQSLDTRLEASPGGWLEQTELVVLATGDCDRIDLRLPADVALREAWGRLRLGDDTKRKVTDPRWETLPRGVSGEGLVRVHVPDLLEGDRAVLRVTREWPTEGGFRWRPGLDGAQFAELRVAPDALVESWGVQAPGRGRFWVAEPDVHAEVRVGANERAAPSAADTRIFGLPAFDALSRASKMALLPRGLDGPSPVHGQAALNRGAADDRGFARTLARLASEGPDLVELGWWLPARGDRPTAEEGEVAVWWSGDSPTLLAHPDAPPRAGRVWTPSGVFEAEHASEPMPEPAHPPVRVHRSLTLQVPERRDPQLSLWPGGGSSVQVVETLTFEDHGQARPWFVPMPPGHDGVDVSVEPDGSPTTWRETDHGVLLVVAPSRGRVEVTVTWQAPDAPSWGEVRPREGEELSVHVAAPRGTIRWEGDRAWRLVELDGVPVLPDRGRLVAALGYRYDGLSLPEPGLPLHLKGHEPGWELAALLRPALHARAVPLGGPGAQLQSALWPRRLMKARNSGVVTSVEAALIVRLYAMQARMPAAWALVRPAWDGPGPAHVPAGYSEGLVRLTWQGEQRWIDPGCTVCGPFELRPHLEGASALGPDLTSTPPPTPGRHAVELRGDTVTWRLDGPPALLLRGWLRDIPTSEREAALAARIAGSGAELIGVEGVSEPGAPIVLVARGPSASDPLAIDDAWVPWIGERSTTLGGATGAVDTDAFSWARSHDGERLEVKRRRWTDRDLAALRAARAATEPTEPDEPAGAVAPEIAPDAEPL